MKNRLPWRWLPPGLVSSLRGRLLLLALLTVLPAFGTLLYWSFEQRRRVEAEARESALRLVRFAALEQKHMIAGARQELLTMARLPIVERPEWAALCSQTLAELRRLHPLYANIAVADRRGNMRCSAVPMKSPVNVADRDYFREALAIGDLAVGGYQIGRVTDKAAVNFGYPLHGQGGDADGVVFIAIDLAAWLGDIGAGVPMLPGTSLLLVNDRGTILARQPDPDAWVGKTLPDTPLIKAVLAQPGEGSLEEDGLDGTHRLNVYMPIHVSPTGRVYLVAGIPTEAVFGEVNRVFLGSLSVLAVVALLVLGSAWLGSRYMFLRPVAALVRAVERLGQGDLHARTELPRRDGELGVLACAFDRMAENLERVNRALKTLSAGNRAMVRADQEQRLLEDMCRAIVEVGGYRAAAVWYRESHAADTLRPMAAVGGNGDLETSQSAKTAGDDEYPVAAINDAIRTGQTRVARNAGFVTGDALLRAPERCDASVLVCPLRVQGEVIGALAIHASEPDAFDREEQKLLDESAADLAYGIATLRTRAAHDAAHATIQRMTHYDPVTGLPNEVLFMERLAMELRAADERNLALALLQIDVAHLREINGALGFAHGDKLLQAFAARLRESVGGDGMIVRLRGGDFALLLPDTGARAAVDAARGIEKALASSFMIGDVLLSVQSCIGVVTYPGQGTDPGDLLRNMDTAVQQVKKSGNGVDLYHPVDEQHRPRRLALAGEMRGAIENGDLELHLQPKVEIATGRVCGCEGLVRWRHAKHGMIPSAEFISLAESTGLIKPLTDWVIETVLRQAHAWRCDGFTLPIAVNLSARSLRSAELVGKIRDRLANWGAAPGQLEIEITESAVMEDPEHTLGILLRLKDEGIPLFIDDFGTGYSSLSYLQKLPVDAIKIDRSFVGDMPANKDSALIVRSTIDLAHDLGLKVVAEGVECRDIWDRLAALRCDVAQGYFLGRPMPAGAFREWVARFRAPEGGGDC